MPLKLAKTFQDNLYLLQSRPITTLSNWTDFELLHEFDTPIQTEQEIFTRANIAEVMPGAATSLTQSFILTPLNYYIYMNAMNNNEKPFAMNFVGIFHQQGTINVTNTFLNKISETVTAANQIVDMAIFGHVVINEKIHAVGKARHGVLTNTGRRMLLLKSIVEVYQAEGIVRKAINLGCHFKIKVKEEKSAWDMYKKIEEVVEKGNLIYYYHMKATNASVFSQVLAISVLAGRFAELTNDHFYDIALLLSSCADVVSAEIPKALERICNIIRENDLAEKFIKIKPEDGVNWLRISCPKAAVEFDSFLAQHGHRSQREFELRADSWGMNPGLVIEMLQINCRGNAVVKETEILDETQTIQKLQTPENNTVRKILKFLVKRCRKAVCQRESTKSELVRIMNECRLAFRELGKQMVLEGILPEPTLLYHFSTYELKQILKKKDPSLIQKAMRRQRLYPQWEKIRLPELLLGVPKLEEDDSEIKNLLKNSEGKLRLNGTPVCPGDIVARACVINSLSEIEQLQTGDVLVTYSTDVGWSPYFPILAGVVTELGGLISHGAVVAREYGLPCIVGVQNATRVFKTGDTVLLSGKAGILELVKKITEDS